jgi:hypothetical protein
MEQGSLPRGSIVINTTRPRKKKQYANLTAFPAPTITASNTTEQLP